MLNHRNEENYTQELKSSSHREGQACSYLALYFFFPEAATQRAKALCSKKKKAQLTIGCARLKGGVGGFFGDVAWGRGVGE